MRAVRDNPDGSTTLVQDDRILELEAGADVESAVAAFFEDEPPIVPASVSPLQIRKALRAAGLMPAVKAFLAQAGDEIVEAWEYATQIDRDNALIATAAAGLGMNEGDIDGLFILASTMT